MAIPIENIYYLLCYAWNTLDEKEKVKVSAEDSTELLELFTKVLINGTKILLKRGIEKNYVSETVEFAGIKGKLELGETIKSGLFLKQRTVCTIDEFSGNILSNRILLSTFYKLIKTVNLDQGLKRQLKPLIWMFSGIEPIEINQRLFKQVKLHRNNRFYDFLMKVCRLIFENTLPTEKPGEYYFVDFLRDEAKMNKLFELFLLNFYKREFPAWRVRSEQLSWQFASANQNDMSFLPAMLTDISIDAPNKKFIIDAKFYRESLSSRYGTEKIKSVNMYQLFSYLLNQRSEDPLSWQTTGILLYPTTDLELDLSFLYQLHPIQIRTVNLNMNWREIDRRLRRIVTYET